MADPFTFTDEVDNNSDSKGKVPLLPSKTSSKENPNPMADPFTFTDEINNDPSETSSKKRKRKRKRKKKAPQITDFKYIQEDHSPSQVQPPQPATEPTAAPATRTLPKTLIKPKVPTSLEEVISMYSMKPDTKEDDRDLLEVVAMAGMHFNMPSWWRPGGYDDDD